MQESDAVFEAVLTAIDRRDAVIAARMLAAQRSLQEVASLMQLEQVRPPMADELAAAGQEPDGTRAPNDRENDCNRDRDHDRDRVVAGSRSSLRQGWFLEALRAGRRVGAAELAERWSISEETARRDIARLKAAGLIEFLGSRRSGRYRPMR
jgi:predicted HTH transcriptional regulator